MTTADGSETSFRAKVSSFLAREVAPDWRDEMASDPIESQRDWVSAVRAAGLGPPHWPVEVGGPGFSMAEQIVLYEEFALADAPPYPGLFNFGFTHAFGTLMQFGTTQQREEHLPRILDASRIWCQAFSEPGAGSDLAGLRTEAKRIGDRYVVNGQKTWASGAADADWALLLARTDPAAPKRKGISYFLVDLRSPGIEVRPIRQMTGDAEFAEIFFTDVEVPIANLVGEEHDGWRVANSTLAVERGPQAVPPALRLRRACESLAPLVAEHIRGGDVEDSAVAQRFAQLHAESEVLVQLVLRTLESTMSTGESGPGSSIIKIFVSELMQRLTGFAVELQGLEGQLEAEGPVWELPSGHWLTDHTRSWMWTISAGANEIQRNIVAERVLLLPREPQVG